MLGFLEEEGENRREEVTDYVFLSQPAVLTVVVEGGVGCGFVYQLSCEWVAKWNHKVQCPSKDGIYGLQQAGMRFQVPNKSRNLRI